MWFNVPMSKETTFAGNGLPSISANEISPSLGMKVQYFDIANQNSPIMIVTAIDLHPEFGTYPVYELLNSITGATEESYLRGFGWTVVTALDVLDFVREDR